jgi:murein DD-endopeptidase MepM/ murein hydrolase activator NlpD
MNKHILLENYVHSHPRKIGNVVDFDPEADRLCHLDFTKANTELNAEVVGDTARFSSWVSKKLTESHCRYGAGGYMEHRTIYARSEHFNTDNEPRRLHLGVDIWGEAGTVVYAPLSGHIHSFRDNDKHGDYGPTIILRHQLDGLELFSLYGHLSLVDLAGLTNGDPVEKGEILGSFGKADENGHWPPHLHFQLIFDMEGMYGDYPGVAKFSEKDHYLSNIPDPNLILRFPGL